MYLKSIEMQGFKSFANKTILQFHDGITGVVGPNGSGKSNVGDAVRWVLGEQSAKALRGGKMEDVIFNGTQKRKRMGYCEVSLVFENEDHALSVDYTEVMITRRVYRSGEGEYYINKSACRLKDIVELFRDTGVGKEGYSIIGQGRIDEILSQKSEDRRGVFEEAAGIVKYRTRKEESEKRLSNMRDNLSRVEDIIAELESQLEPLEKASETARRYLNLRDELRVLECSAFVLRSDRAKERIAEAEQLLTGLKEAIASEEKRADALSEQREKANEGAQKLENEVTAAHDAVLELTRETEAREGELGVLRAEINRMEKDVLALGQEEDVKRARSAALDEEIAKNERDALANRTRIIGLTRELGQKEEALQNAQEEARQAEEKLEAHKSAIIDAMNRLSDVRTSEARLSTMRRELERRGEEADAQKEELEQAADRMDEQLAQAAQELATREVVVVPTKTVPQGITAMLSFDETQSASENAELMTESLAGVTTMQITYAARNSDFEGRDIHEGEYLALYNGALLGNSPDLDALLSAMAEKTAEEGKEFINIFYGAGEPLWKFGIFQITLNGIYNAIFVSVRIIALILASSVLTFTTSPTQLTDAIERLLKPLAKLRVPVHEFAMMMTIALRFIPTLIEETDKIMSAQKARGADFETGNLIQRAKALLPLLVPLFVSAFRRADELAMAMECRCYHGGEGRTKLSELHYQKRDYLAYLSGAALLAVMIVLRQLGL